MSKLPIEIFEKICHEYGFFLGKDKWVGKMYKNDLLSFERMMQSIPKCKQSDVFDNNYYLRLVIHGTPKRYIIQYNVLKGKKTEWYILDTSFAKQVYVAC
jgi:hypothetical protein